MFLQKCKHRRWNWRGRRSKEPTEGRRETPYQPSPALGPGVRVHWAGGWAQGYSGSCNSSPISLGPRKSLARVLVFRATAQTSVNGQAMSSQAFTWLQILGMLPPGSFTTTPTPLCISQPLWLNLCLQQSPQVRLKPHRPQGQGK